MILEILACRDALLPLWGVPRKTMPRVQFAKKRWAFLEVPEAMMACKVSNFDSIDPKRKDTSQEDLHTFLHINPPNP